MKLTLPLSNALSPENGLLGYMPTTLLYDFRINRVLSRKQKLKEIKEEAIERVAYYKRKDDGYGYYVDELVEARRRLALAEEGDIRGYDKRKANYNKSGYRRP